MPPRTRSGVSQSLAVLLVLMVSGSRRGVGGVFGGVYRVFLLSVSASLNTTSFAATCLQSDDEEAEQQTSPQASGAKTPQGRQDRQAFLRERELREEAEMRIVQMRAALDEQVGWSA